MRVIRSGISPQKDKCPSKNDYTYSLIGNNDDNTTLYFD